MPVEKRYQALAPRYTILYTYKHTHTTIHNYTLRWNLQYIYNLDLNMRCTLLSRVRESYSYFPVARSAGSGIYHEDGLAPLSSRHVFVIQGRTTGPRRALAATSTLPPSSFFAYCRQSCHHRARISWSVLDFCSSSSDDDLITGPYMSTSTCAFTAYMTRFSCRMTTV